jgi:hypothetical protein
LQFSRGGRIFAIGLAAAALLAAGIWVARSGGDKSGGPVGAPETVVGKAPDTTLAQGTAKIFITAPSANAAGVVDLHARSGRLTVSATGFARPADLVVAQGVGRIKTPPATTYLSLPGAVPSVLPSGDPFVDIDLVRGTVHILSNGGGEVEGVSTISYTLTVDPQQAIETTPADRQGALTAILAGRTSLFQMEVWIDSQFRLRRIEVPDNFSFKSVTPPTRVDGATIGTDVDFVTFGVPVPNTP